MAAADLAVDPTDLDEQRGVGDRASRGGSGLGPRSLPTAIRGGEGLELHHGTIGSEVSLYG